MNRFSLFISTVIFSLPSWALTPEDVVQSSLTHFPQVIQSLQNVSEAENKVKMARGSFDAKLKGSADARTDGYYDGDHYKASLEKPFAFLNSRAYVGHRQSYGEFPSYEGKSNTLSGGEAFAGFSLSLLRNSLIDFNRYTLQKEQENAEQAKVRLRQTQIGVQTLAIQAYWTWLTKGHEYQVYKNILKLAEARSRNISKRIKAGDLAKIYLSENNQYIRKRQASMTQSLLEYQEASYYLSLFLRDNNGAPRQLTGVALPKTPTSQNMTTPGFAETYKRVLDESLDLKVLSSQKRQANLDVRLGNNLLLPKLDLNVEWNQDQGQGINSLQQDENRILLKLEVPLQFRKGLGKKRAGQAKAAQVETKERWTTEKIKFKVQSLIAKIGAFSEIYKLTMDQVQLAEKLASAERRKFSQGASDLILVNLREENLAEAQVKNLSSLLKYYYVDAEVKKAKVEFIAKP